MGRSTRIVLVLAMALVGTGCSEEKRPWEAAPDASVRDATVPFLRPAETTTESSQRVGAANAARPQSGLENGDVTALGMTEKTSAQPGAGKSFRTCLGEFRPETEPIRDVERLGLACGPSTGMARLGDTVTGVVSPDGEVALAHSFSARAGECYRAFAVGAATVEELELTLRTSHKHRLAADDLDGRVAAVPSDRALCILADDTLSAEVSATLGEGAFALQIFRLPASRNAAAVERER
ncbi:MAG: hypothetical protein EXR75_11430 [Myxococcales bacterium]|nr:hypothetical protein [Myxococcales bacterium]